MVVPVTTSSDLSHVTLTCCPRTKSGKKKGLENQILIQSFKSSKCLSPVITRACLARAVARTHESTKPHLLNFRLRSALILPATSAISSSRELIVVFARINLSLSFGSKFSRIYLSVNSATTTAGVIPSPLSMNGFAFSPLTLPAKYSIQAKVSITSAVVRCHSLEILHVHDWLE